MCVSVDWIQLAYDKDQLLASLNSLMKTFRIHRRQGIS